MPDDKLNIEKEYRGLQKVSSFMIGKINNMLDDQVELREIDKLKIELKEDEERYT